MKLRSSFVLAVLAGAVAFAQNTATPTNDLPNPYETIKEPLKLPEGRKWGSTSAVDVDKDGMSIWVGERCGENKCADASGKMSPLDPVLKFDASGKLVKSFGAGMIAFAHGIHVDRDGNVWVTDANESRRRREGDRAKRPPLPRPRQRRSGIR
jgi:streptogramin lyase